MQAAENASDAALAFQLAASLDLYLAQLDELEAGEPEQSSAHLTALTDTVRSIRLRCASFPNLYSLFVELLIGHSELVAAAAQTFNFTCSKRRRSALVAPQRQRAEYLLRMGIGPMKTGI